MRSPFFTEDRLAGTVSVLIENEGYIDQVTHPVAARVRKAPGIRHEERVGFAKREPLKPAKLIIAGAFVPDVAAHLADEIGTARQVGQVGCLRREESIILLKLFQYRKVAKVDRPTQVI